MSNEPSSPSPLPGADEFLRKLGIDSHDSDFTRLRDQVKRAIDLNLDLNAAAPSHWEDPYIEKFVTPNSSVIDLGCGNGQLLAHLAKTRHAVVQGVENDEEAVLQCIERGVPVYHDRIVKALHTMNDKAYDFAVLENTLQTLVYPYDVLTEMLRVAKTVIVSFPNFAHWTIRMAFSIGGRMPVTSALPYSWYNTPNIHLCSITDFQDWMSKAKVEMVDAYVYVEGKVVPFQTEGHHHNITAEQALFILRSQE